MAELNKLTLKTASEKLQNGEISSVDLVDDCLAQIEKHDTSINAYLMVMAEEAKKAAVDADKRRSEGRVASKIDGLPIAIKDVICTKGFETTAASQILKGFVPPYDATVISKLKDAGAVILGKTNMDEFAMGSSTENSAYKTTKNPWDLGRVPGGSSGGSAAAVASDMCLGALGSDTGGSIRFPSSLCGVVGLKPTYGTVSRYGLMAMASSLDQIGPFGKTVDDAKMLFEIISGPDKMDSTSLNKSFTKPKDPKEMIIGVPKEYFAEGLDAKVKKVIEEAIEKIKKEVKEVKEVSLPRAEYALPVYYNIVFVEVASNLARYDGIKYGQSAKDAKSLIEVYLKTRSQNIGSEAKRRIILGTYASSAGYIDQYYLKAQKVRALVKSDFDEAFNEVDLLVGPVSPSVAFKFGEKADDPLAMYLSDIYTISINLCGIPAMSVPAGLAGGLPVGLQIIGPAMSEDNIFALGNLFERSRGVLPSPSLQ